MCVAFYADIDKDMDKACEKLDAALGGVPYLGIHPFGEQGPFPGGDSRHGNLMFSAIAFTSRRYISKISNVDTGEEIYESDKVKFEQAVMTGGLLE